MPLKSVLNRVFAPKAFQISDPAEPSAVQSGTDGTRKTISKVETAAVLRGILKEEQMGCPAQHRREDSLQ